MQISKVCQIFRIHQSAAFFDDFFLGFYPAHTSLILEQIFVINLSVILLFHPEHFFSFAVSAEDHVNDEPKHRDEQQHKKPRPAAGRISSFKKHHKASQNHVDDQNPYGDIRQNGNNLHRLPPFFPNIKYEKFK